MGNAEYASAGLGIHDKIYKHLEYFVILSETKSITEAATACFISQQGLSRAIKSLEQELDVQLITRSSTGVHLTQCGESVCRHSKKILSEYQSMCNELSDIASSAQQVLRAAFPYEFFIVAPSDFITGFREAWPDTELVIHHYRDYDLDQAVLADNVDCGFSSTLIEHPDLEYIPLIQDSWCAMVSQEHPFFNRDAISVPDLQTQQVVVADKSYKDNEVLHKLCDKYGFRPNILMSFQEITSFFNYVKEKSCVGFNLMSVYQRTLDSGIKSGVKLLPFNDVDDFSICIIVKRGKRKTNAVRHFIAYTQEFYSNIILGKDEN